MRVQGSWSAALLCAVFLAVSAAAGELSNREAEALRQPPVQSHLATPRLKPGDLSAAQQAESYRSSLIGSIQQLERAQSTDRDVQDRLQQLRGELSRVENRLIDSRRR
jgi:hypothetical protein